MEMANIYDQYDAAFRKVEAFVVVKDGERVASVAFKHPASGEGRLYAYVHWLGLEMVRGWASGYGYDKRTAACASAAGKMLPAIQKALQDALGGHDPVTQRHDLHNAQRLADALALDGSQHWDSALRNAGFTVWQAV